MHVSGHLLKEVSRSFYLTLRALPRGMRRPVCLAYLLARATDTLADSQGLPPETRLDLLEWLAGEIESNLTATAWEDEPLAAAITAQRNLHPGEARLLEAVPQLLEELRGLPREDAVEIRQVLRTISGGQVLDLVRFELGAAPGEVRALATAAELEDYTYRVAGCVGEFWTRLACRKLRHYSNLPEGELLDQGVAFGKGLQLVNILRDFPGDLEKGRCYLPADELRAKAGLSAPADLRRGSRQAEIVWTAWAETAEGYLEIAREYSLSLSSWRMRFACILPVVLGTLTLHQARQHLAAHPDEAELPRGIKVPRSVVRRQLWQLLWASRTRAALRRRVG